MSEIKSWYAGKNVLITGGTGYIGKVLVERLLRDCDDVNCIYLIMREKKKINFETRCQTFLNHLIFDHLRNSNPGQLKKIKIIQGDLAETNIGLTKENLIEIENDIDIVIHSGADVRFDLTLGESLTTNTIGTFQLLELAKRIKKLQVFVYVSTTYSQSNQFVTEERHYDAVIDGHTLIKACKRFDDQTMTALQPKILKEFPNTYSFSKHLSEDIMYRYRNEFPICVVRPSIVGCALKHPLPNYTEGLQALNGLSYATLRGVFRTLYCDPSALGHVVPLDIVSNTIIATSWIHGVKKQNDIEYYNTTISSENLVTISQSVVMGNQIQFEYPLNYSVWSPNCTATNCAYYFYIRLFFYQILPSALLDLLILMFRYKPIMLKVQRKIYHGQSLVYPYLQKMAFKTDKFKQVRNYLNQVDNEIFDSSTDHVTPTKFGYANAKGIRKFVAKETDEDLPRAKRNSLIWYWIHVTMRCIVVFYLVKLLCGRIF